MLAVRSGLLAVNVFAPNHHNRIIGARWRDERRSNPSLVRSVALNFDQIFSRANTRHRESLIHFLTPSCQLQQIVNVFFDV